MDDWYDNKQLYEMLQTVKQDISEMRKEMVETRTLIRDYNNIRQKVEDTAGKVNFLMWMTPIALSALGVLFAILNYFK